MIDLTKPIKVYIFRKEEPPNPRLLFDVLVAKAKDFVTETGEAHAYCQLFQDAPRTKLEHGKMLAGLKDLQSYCDEGRICESCICDDRTCFRCELDALIAEIEGRCPYCGVIGDNAHCQVPQTAEMEGAVS